MEIFNDISFLFTPMNEINNLWYPYKNIILISVYIFSTVTYSIF